MNIDEIILKCQIGEEHLDQAEYEQVARWLIQLKELKTAYKLACESLRRVCAEMDICMLDCPLSMTEKCQAGIPCSVDFAEGYIEKAKELSEGS